jgi:hypothetical protein
MKKGDYRKVICIIANHQGGEREGTAAFKSGVSIQFRGRRFEKYSPRCWMVRYALIRES